MTVYIGQPVKTPIRELRVAQMKYGDTFFPMIADSSAEMHDFARLLGLEERLFHSDPYSRSLEHYDVPAYLYKVAITFGAQGCTNFQISLRAMRRAKSTTKTRSKGDKDAPPAKRGRPRKSV